MIFNVGNHHRRELPPSGDSALSERPVNTDLVLPGPESLSYDDVAAILTETGGRVITHKRLDPAEQPAYCEALGVPEAAARFTVGLDAVIAHGSEDRTTDTAERVTGTPPRSFRDFAAAEFPRLGAHVGSRRAESAFTAEPATTPRRPV